MKLKFYVQAFVTGRFTSYFTVSFITLMLAVQLHAQTVPVGTPFFEDALRRAQLMGRLDPNVSFTIRPVDPLRAFKLDNPFGSDTLLFPLDSNTYSRYADLKGKVTLAGGINLNKNVSGREANFRLTLLPVLFHTRYNHHHPYGWSDGPMVPARGMQVYLSGGIYAKAGIFEAQLRPEYVLADNREFQNPPFRPGFIDLPERMGQANYEKAFLGQSFVKVHLGPVAAGLSTENIWWGPGRKNSIIMTNNAPGFGHFTLHTNKPVLTRIGSFEGQMVAGKLRRSGFTYPLRFEPGEWPPIAGNVMPDTANGDSNYGYINAMAAVYQPKWLPGLFLGATRAIQVIGEPSNIGDYFKIIYLESRGEKTGQGPDPGAISRNQLISLFARYLFPESHAEIYMEVGREDNWWDFEDLITRVQYSTVYNAGFRKMYELSGKDRWLEVSGEYTKLQSPVANMVQPRASIYSFYTHGSRFGWTNRGQVLGAGIGPGSNMGTVGLAYGHGFNMFSLQFERIAYNEDLFYSGIDYLKLGDGSNPFFVDASKNFIDWSFIFNHHTSFGNLMFGYQLQLLRTYNFQWNYDPYGGAGPFRFPGINVWSLNGELTMLYRF